MRASGYYWVKLRNEWTIAKWILHGDLSLWTYSGYSFYDSDFEEIDERRIERKESLPERPRTNTTTTQDRY